MNSFGRVPSPVFRCTATPPPEPAPEDPFAELKDLITRTIQDDYLRAGRPLSKEQLDYLVHVQLERAKDQRKRIMSPQPSGIFTPFHRMRLRCHEKSPNKESPTVGKS